ncbi:hypothetical protein ABK040_012883 [Willaertia magna]
MRKLRTVVEDLPLAYFVLRTQTLKFYREILKDLNKVNREDTKKEVFEQIKPEFLAFKTNRDVERGKKALSEGKTRYKQLKDLIYMTH